MTTNYVTAKRYSVGMAEYSTRGVQHGYARPGRESREWLTWKYMRQRCGVIGKGAPRYVARGMAEEWKQDFPAFLAYILATIGAHPGQGWTIDRINNDRGYFPGNIRWATRAKQLQQGGVASTGAPRRYSEEGLQAARENGHKIGLLRGATGERGPDGRFRKESA